MKQDSPEQPGPEGVEMAKKKQQGPKRKKTDIIGFSCPKNLKERIKDAAAKDQRNVSNWIVTQSERSLREKEDDSS